VGAFALAEVRQPCYVLYSAVMLREVVVKLGSAFGYRESTRGIYTLSADALALL
jgi:hypothetical protein